MVSKKYTYISVYLRPYVWTIQKWCSEEDHILVIVIMTRREEVVVVGVVVVIVDEETSLEFELFPMTLLLLPL